MKRIYVFLIFLTLIVFLSAPPAFSKDPGGRYLVLIDPGHGGSDQGVKVSSGTFEKDLTLAIANMVKSDLENAGYAVKLTRTGDSTVEPAARMKMANDQETDLFLSIHINAGFGREAEGYEIFFPGFNSPSQSRNESGEIVKDMVKNQNLNESVRLSRIVQKNLETVLPRKDRGLQEAPLRVQPAIPSLVIELGFASNPSEKKQLTSRDTQKKIAGVLAASVREFVSTGKTRR